MDRYQRRRNEVEEESAEFPTSSGRARGAHRRLASVVDTSRLLTPCGRDDTVGRGRHGTRGRARGRLASRAICKTGLNLGWGTGRGHSWRVGDWTSERVAGTWLAAGVGAHERRGAALRQASQSVTATREPSEEGVKIATPARVLVVGIGVGSSLLWFAGVGGTEGPKEVRKRWERNPDGARETKKRNGFT